jgi:hypothetical protein
MNILSYLIKIRNTGGRIDREKQKREPVWKAAVSIDSAWNIDDLPTQEYGFALSALDFADYITRSDDWQEAANTTTRKVNVPDYRFTGSGIQLGRSVHLAQELDCPGKPGSDSAASCNRITRINRVMTDMATMARRPKIGSMVN